MIKKNVKLLCLAITVLLSTTNVINAVQPIIIKPVEGDMTPIIRQIIEETNEKDIKLIFESGTYWFNPDYAFAKYCDITNHNNGMKHIVFNFSKFRSVEIEGNNAEFIFHGMLLPFQFEQCNSIRISNIVIDWDIPFIFSGEVIAINKKEGWRDIKPYTDGFSWKLRRGRVEFPDINGFSYSCLGSSLPFDVKEKRPVHGAWDMYSRPRWVEKLPNGILRFHEPLEHYPPVGSLLVSKGDEEHNRYAPAIETKSSENIELNGVVVHHALGMGYLFERCENIKILNSGVYLRENTQRVISSTADATHFCNCKGHILIENCRFENMLDDGTNVHGTYVEVDKILNEHTIRVKLKHSQQLGFTFAEAADEVWFIRQPSPQRQETGVVSKCVLINEQYSELSFEKKIPKELKPGDFIENKTWNPEFTMRGCTVQNNRARNIVLKTPMKIVIENNFFSSMMSSVFFRGETYYWFESGAVRDVIIRNNTFDYCAYSGSEHSVINITPLLGKLYNQTVLFDHNIRIENNTICTFDNRIVRADRVDGLIIKGNNIIKTNQAPQLHPNAPNIELINCRNVLIEGNSFQGGNKLVIKADDHSKKTLTFSLGIGSFKHCKTNTNE